MIKTVAGKRTRRFCDGQRVRDFEAFERQAQRRLIVLADATCIEDLMQMRSNRFEALGGDRNGQCNIRINEQWRICFRFEDGDAYDVEIIDYH
jgi:proteic killer suppression protein